MYSKSEPPMAISHRGLRHDAPENSIPAFLAAIDAGAAAVELDVHSTADGAIYVHHDQAPGGLDSKGNPWRPIAEMDSNEIAHARLFGDVEIPTLDAVIEAIDGRAGIFIEIKGVAVEDALVRCLKRHLTRIDQFSVHSFDHRIIRRMNGLMPSVRTGILQVSYLVDSCATLRLSGATDLWQQVDLIDAALVSGVHACRGKVIAWTANTVDQWEKLDRLNVDAVCTDKVDEYVAWMADRA